MHYSSANEYHTAFAVPNLYQHRSEVIVARMYTMLFLLITLHMLTTQGHPLDEARLQNMLRAQSIIFTREEAEAMVNESQSHGTSCDSLSSHGSTDRLPRYATSLCPWYYEMVHQPGLFPSHVLRAKLRCNNSENSPCKMRNPLDYTCVYIRRGIRMVNETCQGYSCEFIRNVRVGAQCIHTQTSP